MFLKEVFELFIRYFPQLMLGVGNTLLIAVFSTLAGLFIGIVVGVIRAIPPSRRAVRRAVQRVVNFLLGVYIEIFRGTPMMVQAMVIFWGTAYAFGTRPPLMPSALAIVSINTGAYIAEIVRGGILSVNKGQFDGAYAVGMTYTQAMLHVIIPQVLKNILPAIGNEFVINIKDTSVLNVIGVAELYFQAGTMISGAKIFEAYLIISVLYLIMTFTITRLLRLMEKLMEGKANYELSAEAQK